MTEMNQLPRDSTLSLLKDVENSYLYFKEEADNAFEKQLELKEKLSVLKAAFTKTNSGMAQTLMKNMIKETEDAIKQEVERQRLGENNKKYYSEIKKALEEAIKEF